MGVGVESNRMPSLGRTRGLGSAPAQPMQGLSLLTDHLKLQELLTLMCSFTPGPHLIFGKVNVIAMPIRTWGAGPQARQQVMRSPSQIYWVNR